MAKLGVNIDHIATIRQARRTAYPDPITAAAIVEKAGADQITIHLREDRRHIQDGDLRILRKTVTTALNLEMAASEEIVGIALEVVPDVITFVPEKRQELTTEGGIDVVKYFRKLRGYTSQLKEKSIVVSMFIDPDIPQIEATRELGADAVELHTGRYCELYDGVAAFRLREGGRTLKGATPTDPAVAKELERLKKAAKRASEAGLHVAAGHGLNYDNTALVVREIPEIVEYNIGHAIVARAVFVGLAQAVGEIKKIVGGA